MCKGKHNKILSLFCPQNMKQHDNKYVIPCLSFDSSSNNLQNKRRIPSICTISNLYGITAFLVFLQNEFLQRGGKTQEQRDEKYTSKKFSLLLYFEKILLKLSSLAFAITCLNNGEVMNRVRISFLYTGTKPNERKTKKRQSKISPSQLPAAARKLSLIQFF